MVILFDYAMLSALYRSSDIYMPMLISMETHAVICLDIVLDPRSVEEGFRGLCLDILAFVPGGHPLGRFCKVELDE